MVLMNKHEAGPRLSRIWLTQTSLPWKRNRLLLGIPLSATKYRTTIKSVRSIRPVTIKSTFRVWTSRELPLFYWKYHICSFISIFYRSINQWNNQNRYSRSRENNTLGEGVIWRVPGIAERHTAVSAVLRTDTVLILTTQFRFKNSSLHRQDWKPFI
jgi:hypothetical protein